MLAHHLAEPDKGSGIAMICTFGDLTDVTWWRELDLPTRPVIGWDGRLLPEPPGRRRRAGAVRRAGGQDRARRPRARSSSCCASPATWTASRGRSRTPVKFYEKGDRPLEIVTTRQWYIRNGGRDADAARAAAERGAASCAGTRRTCGSATRTGSRGWPATG